MPLMQSRTEEAFWANYKKLLKEGYSKEQALAIAASICRKNGGNPDKFLGKEEK